MPSIDNHSDAIFGIAAEPLAGLIIQDYSSNVTSDKLEVKSRAGYAGAIYYNKRAEINLNALVPQTSAWAGQIGSVIVLTSFLPTYGVTGSILVDSIQADAEIEGLQKLAIKATILDGFTV